MITVDTGHTDLRIEPDRTVTRFLPPDEEAAMRELARLREQAHEGQDSSRPLGKDYELIGCVGEWGFEDITGIPMDRSILPAGDGRVDFETGIGPVDVKCAAKAYNLLREVDTPHADILVLAQFYKEPLGVTLLGWEWDYKMVLQATRRFHDEGPMNHWKPARTLQPMTDLYWRLVCLDRARAGVGLGLTEPVNANR